MAVEANIMNGVVNPDQLFLTLTETTGAMDTNRRPFWSRAFGKFPFNVDRSVSEKTSRVETRTYATANDLKEDISREKSWLTRRTLAGYAVGPGAGVIEFAALLIQQSGSMPLPIVLIEGIGITATVVVGTAIIVSAESGKARWNAAADRFRNTRFRADGLIEVPEVVTAQEGTVQESPAIQPSVNPAQA